MIIKINLIKIFNNLKMIFIKLNALVILLKINILMKNLKFYYKLIKKHK